MRIRTLASATWLACALTSWTFGQGRGGPGDAGPPEGVGGPPPHILERYDTNGDGILDDDEIAAARRDGARRPGPQNGAPGRGGPRGGARNGPPEGVGGPPPHVLERYDTNGDGVLDDDEIAAARRDGARRPGRGGPRGGARNGPPEGVGGPPPHILERYDTNGDGVLDDDEIAAARRDGARRPGPQNGAPEDAVLAPLVAAEPSAVFTRGDADLDSTVGIADGLVILAFLYRGAHAPPCLDAADADDDGRVGLPDVIAVFTLLFQGGSELPEPYPNAGTDGTPDALDCTLSAL